MSAPRVLPRGRALVYTLMEDTTRAVFAMAIDGATPDVRRLLPGVGGARYVPSGHLLYGLENRLMAVPFDADRLEVTGPGQEIHIVLNWADLIVLVNWRVRWQGSGRVFTRRGLRDSEGPALVNCRPGRRPKMAHLLDPGGPHAVRKFEKHSRSGDHARQQRGAAPRAAGDAQPFAATRMFREPSSGCVERAITVRAEGVGRVPCSNDDQVARLKVRLADAVGQRSGRGEPLQTHDQPGPRLRLAVRHST